MCNNRWRLIVTALFVINCHPAVAVVYDIKQCSELIEYNGEAYFCGYHHKYGRELFRTDGTRQGTYVVDDIDTGPGSSDPHGFFKLNERLYFFAETATTGYELYVTNGIPKSTRLIKDTIVGPSGHVNRFCGGNCILGSDTEKYFKGSNGIWRTDGRFSGTEKILSTDSNSTILGYLNGSLVYAQRNELFKISNSSSKGVLFKRFDVDCRIRRLGNIFASFNPILIQLDCPNVPVGVSRFSAWVTDASSGGTKPIPDFATGLTQYLGELNGRHYFYVYCYQMEGCADSIVHTDGNSTTIVLTAEPNLSRSIVSVKVKFNNNLVFGWRGDTWLTDGTAENTRALTNIYEPYFESNRQAGWATVGGNMLFFQADKTRFPIAQNRNELWVSNGSVSGTTKIVDFGARSYANEGITIGNKHYFFVRTGSDIYELWVTDATSAGTQQLASFSPNVGGDYLSSAFGPTPEGNRFYFQGGNYLWHSDGSMRGTYKLTYGSGELLQETSFLIPMLFLLLEDEELSQ